MINYSEKIKKSALSPITFMQDEVSAVFELQDEVEELYRLSCIIQIGDKILENERVKLFTPLFLLTLDNKAYLFKDREQSVILKQFQESSYFAFDRKALGQLLPMLNKLKTKCGLRTNTSTAISEKILYGGKKELYFSELGQFIIIKPYINFEDTYKQNALTEQIDDQVEEVLFEIKGDEATNFIQQLSEFHDVFTKGEQVTDFFAISLHDFLSDNWFFDFFEKCKRLDIDVYGTDILQNFKFNKNKPTISAVISSGIDWFGSKVKISFDKLNVPLNSWVDMVKNNQKYIKLSDGTLGVMPEEWVEKLKALYNAGFQEDGQIKVSKYNFSIIDEYFDELSDEEAFEEIKKKKKAFENYTSIKSYRLPRSIKAELREYQMQGYRWLRFLNEYKLGGCLADDMGLGKTLQVLCLLAYKKERKDCFALVVVPNSLIFNWSNEIEKFCPSLKYLIHHGPNRKVDKIDKKKYDVIITTYGTATSDIEDLKEIIFDSVILDESQAIKNPNSKRYKSVKLLKANHRYAMTGTPIENNTFDLFAQMNFINPGLLGNANSFRTKFAVPIDSQRDQDQGELLRKVIHPFILRRTKEQVAKDLPEKSESIIVCEMGAKQKKYYDSVRNDIKNSLNKALEEDGLGKAKFQMLEGLLRLRQICNSPQLIDKNARGESVKIETLIDHIMGNNTHKALIFSQFVGMLGLIKERLEEMQIQYAYLDGSTKNRQEQVEKFQSDRSCQVFLISIKAGNTGLNLTAADYVYIVDPWWNPAVEAQAIDRTHRIGQVNHVFAYRMVCKDTIEEKILLLQEKKRAVAADIIQTDESVLKSLDKDDLLGLFE
jgi:non-specific serine/threonine protein kinase